MVQLAAKRYGPQRGENIMALYDRVKKGYNEYVEMIGGAIGAGACAALKQGNKIYTIADDVPLLHFLTGRYILSSVHEIDFASYHKSLTTNLLQGCLWKRKFII